MNRWTNMLDPQGEAALRREIGSIPGLEIQRITAMPPANAPNGTTLDVTIRLHGWSPCLNLLGLVWRATVTAGADGATQLGEITIALREQIRTQRRRQREAMSLGRASPFDVCDDDGHRDDTQIAHILVDVALAAMIGHGERLIREVGNTVWDLHHDRQDEKDGSDDVLEGEQTPEYGEPSPGMHGVAGRLFVFEMPLGETGVVYDGVRLRVPVDLPDTMLAACAGRPVRDVVDVQGPVGDRIVVEAVRGDAGGTVLTVEPVAATVADLVGEGMTR